MKVKVNKVTIHISQSDALDLTADAFVNPTDTNLSLSTALAARAGPQVIQECHIIGFCDVGSAVITQPGQLAARVLIHVVGPRWGEGSERGKLANAVLACLRLAEAQHVRSIVMPPISIGVQGYPLENCAKVMIGEIVDFTFTNPRHLKLIMLATPEVGAYQAFVRELTTQIDHLRASGEGQVSV